MGRLPVVIESFHFGLKQKAGGKEPAFFFLGKFSSFQLKARVAVIAQEISISAGRKALASRLLIVKKII